MASGLKSLRVGEPNTIPLGGLLLRWNFNLIINYQLIYRHSQSVIYPD